ncbi:MAG: hypothetical protein ACREIR_24405, partial [Geminicoccaceae bacterium]
MSIVASLSDLIAMVRLNGRPAAGSMALHALHEPVATAAGRARSVAAANGWSSHPAMEVLAALAWHRIHVTPSSSRLSGHGAEATAQLHEARILEASRRQQLRYP